MVIFVFLLIPIGIGAQSVVKINSQNDFNCLQQKILSAIKSGEKDILVSFSPGTYIVKEKHLVLEDINAPDVELHIKGNGAIFVPDGKVYKNGDVYNGSFSPENSWMSGGRDINIWSHVRYADGLVEVLNPATKECRLKGKEAYPVGTDCSNAFILVTQWFRSYVYKVSKVEGHYIFFNAESLALGYQKKGYNINNDYYFASQNPRYKLCNLDISDDGFNIIKGRVRLPSGVNSVREGTVNRIIMINKCTFRNIDISGLVFYGNSNVGNASAISLKNTKSKSICIHHSKFHGFRSNIISLYSSQNASVENNKFQDCYVYGIWSDNGCYGTKVRGNSFLSMGKRMNDTHCVVCRGTDFQVFNNTFTDFGYGGIGAGVHYKTDKKGKCTGIIEGNELSYTKAYIGNKPNYTIMDAGAIYLWTKNDGIKVRYNYIHDIDGMKINQGIYCDDGASNCEIIGNVILGIANSNSIGSRRDDRAEEKKTPGTGIVSSNMNNVIKDNVVDGRILFVGNERKDNGCVVGNNYVLVGKGVASPAHKINNVKTEGKLIELTRTGSLNGRVSVSRASYEILMKSREWKTLKKYVEIK